MASMYCSLFCVNIWLVNNKQTCICMYTAEKQKQSERDWQRKSGQCMCGYLISAECDECIFRRAIILFSGSAMCVWPSALLYKLYVNKKRSTANGSSYIFPMFQYRARFVYISKPNRFLVKSNTVRSSLFSLECSFSHSFEMTSCTRK